MTRAERRASLLGAALAEMFGTYLFVFFGTGAVVAVSTLGKASGLDAPGSLVVGDAAIGLAFGFSILIVVYAFGHISGAHVNPAVTIGMAAMRRFPWSAVPVYVAAQMVGAIIASLTVWLVFPGPVADAPLRLGATAPGPGVGEGIALIAEFALTFMLMVVVMATATDERATPPAVGLAVGLTVGAGIFAMLPVSGGSFNPARSLGPMIVSLSFPGWWLYIVGPTAGALAGALIYDFLLRSGAPPAVSGTVQERPKAGGSRHSS